MSRLHEQDVVGDIIDSPKNGSDSLSLTYTEFGMYEQ